MRRRQFITLLGGAAATWPLAAWAQQPAMPVVGWLSVPSPETFPQYVAAFKQGLSQTGFIDGQGIAIEYREPKRLELLREIAPNTSTVHILVNPNNAGVLQDIPTVTAAAGKIGLGFEVVQAGTESEIDTAFASLSRDKAQAIMVANDAFFTIRGRQIAALAARYAVPTVYPWREQAEVGGLLSYGTSIPEAYRQLGIYVGQVLKGAKTAELPVQQPTKFELVINLRTARALGISVPASILLRADEVIE